MIGAASANAAVEAVMVKVVTNAPFVVPLGKVLIVEHMIEVAEPPPSTSPLGWVEFQMTNSSGAIELAVAGRQTPANDYLMLIKPPFKVPGGWTIACTSADLGAPIGITYGPDFWVFGLLADAPDLYADLQSEIKDVVKQGSSLAMEIQTTSPRPAKVVVEKSSSVAENWQPAIEVVVTPTEDKTKYLATVPIDQEREFFRAKVTAVK